MGDKSYLAVCKNQGHRITSPECQAYGVEIKLKRRSYVSTPSGLKLWPETLIANKQRLRNLKRIDMEEKQIEYILGMSDKDIVWLSGISMMELRRLQKLKKMKK